MILPLDLTIQISRRLCFALLQVSDISQSGTLSPRPHFARAVLPFTESTYWYGSQHDEDVTKRAIDSAEKLLALAKSPNLGYLGGNGKYHTLYIFPFTYTSTGGLLSWDILTFQLIHNPDICGGVKLRWRLRMSSSLLKQFGSAL